MINNFSIVGKSILEKDGYYDSDDELKKRELMLYHHTLMPLDMADRIDRAIVLNFDLDKKEFRFELDRELVESNRKYFFAFKVGSSRDVKKFFSTNNIESFLNRVITDSITFINKRRSKKESSQWFKNNISEDYDRFLELLRDNFYKKKVMKGKNNKDGVEYVLDNSKLAADQAEQYTNIKQRLEENRKDKTKPIPIEKVYTTFLIEKFREEKRVKLPNILLIKIDGKHIMEIEKYRDSYLNLIYYDLFARFFIEELVKEGPCHICREEKAVIGKISLPMKFYGTTNVLYFENINKKNAYKSFALCESCLKTVLVGMKYTEIFLKDYMFGLNCYVVPTLTERDDLFEKKLKGAVKLIKKRQKKYVADIKELERLLEKTTRKKLKFSFNLLFYHAEQQSFDILKYISDIDLRQLIKKMALFDLFTDMYKLELIGKHDNSFCLNDIRYYLFPSDRSHSKPDFKNYGKALLNFLENFLNENKINYFDLISNFTNIFKRRFNRKNTDILSPFKMVLFLTILNKIKILTEGKSMNKGKAISDVMKPEYNDFFKTHWEVYGENSYRQGLFLLGTVIAKIVYAQKEKKKTFLSKINFDGIPARRVKNLVGEVKEYSSIYQVYEEPGIWGNIMDRLQGIETCGMKGDEIVFYILTGVSYDDYLGMKHGLKNKLKQDKGEQDE